MLEKHKEDRTEGLGMHYMTKKTHKHTHTHMHQCIHKLTHMYSTHLISRDEWQKDYEPTMICSWDVNLNKH